MVGCWAREVRLMRQCTPHIKERNEELIEQGLSHPFSFPFSLFSSLTQTLYYHSSHSFSQKGVVMKVIFVAVSFSLNFLFKYVFLAFSSYDSPFVTHTYLPLVYWGLTTRHKTVDS